MLPQSVLLGLQSFSIDALDIERSTWRIDIPGLWIRLHRQRGMGADERLIHMRGHGRPSTGRNLIAIMLGGRGVARHDGRTIDLGAGGVTLLPGHASYAARLEPDVSQFSLTIEVDSTIWGGPPFVGQVGRVAPTCLSDHAEQLCHAIGTAWAHPATRPCVEEVLVDLLARLRAEGLPIPDVDVRSIAPPPASLARVARALDCALSSRGSRAMLVDVEQEGAVCARTVQRALPALCGYWGQGVESFRDLSRRTLLGRACYSMTNPRATTQLVAHAVGFSSPNAFCRAMTSFGLPSPGRIREGFVALA